MDDEQPLGPSDPTRRDFLRTMGSGAAAAVMVGCAAHSDRTGVQSGSPPTGADRPSIHGAVPITLRINGRDHHLRIDPRTTLLDCVRETVALTGTEKGWGHGQFG